MISVNHISDPRDINSIGKVLDGILVDIVDNEILVSGPNVMLGYWNNKDATDEVLVKSKGLTWYKTGDAGNKVDDFLYYNGRISENYKLSNGKFVNVNDTESKLKKYISNFFIIYGENKPYNILIIEKPFDESKLDIVNKNIDNYLKLEKVLYVESDVFADYLTPKMSIKRKKLIKYLEDDINNLYD